MKPRNRLLTGLLLVGLMAIAILLIAPAVSTAATLDPASEIKCGTNVANGPAVLVVMDHGVTVNQRLVISGTANRRTANLQAMNPATIRAVETAVFRDQAPTLYRVACLRTGPTMAANDIPLAATLPPRPPINVLVR